MKNNDVVITGMSALTRYGVGIDSVKANLEKDAAIESRDEYCLEKFPAAKHIADRRMMKAISQVDAIGLVSFEAAVKDSGFAKDQFAPERIGVYVGAPPSSAFDNSFYMDAQKEALETENPATEFGATCMRSKPTALLVGLPNNVLCYGALGMDARGPNSNYTSAETSGHLAVYNAAERIKRDKIDFAVAGAFSGHTEAVYSTLMTQFDIGAHREDKSCKTINAFSDDADSRALIADGSCFMTMESRSSAEARSAKPIATYVGAGFACDGLGPSQMSAEGEGLSNAIEDAISSSGITREQIGVVALTGSGYPKSDLCEQNAMARVFGDSAEKPAVLCLSKHLGWYVEQGGLIEVAVCADALQTREIPAAVSPNGFQEYPRLLDADKPYGLIVRVSPWGEYSALIIKKENQRG